MQSLYALKITVSNYCLYKCKYCYVDTYNPDCISEEKMFQSIDYYLSQKGESKVIFFLWGESLLHFDILKKWILHSRQKSEWKNLNIFITTSGLSLTSEMVDFFYDHNVKLWLSIDGDEKTHWLNRVSRSWKNTYLATLVARKLFNNRYDETWIGYALTVDENTVKKTFESFLFLSHLDEKHRNITIAWVYKKSWGKDNLVLLEKQLEKICHFIYEEISKWNYYFYNVLSFFILELNKWNLLEKWNVEMHVFPDGQVSLHLFAQSVLWNISDDPTQARFSFVNDFAKAILYRAKTEDIFRLYVDELFNRPIL